jgi:hypothetical protein
MLHNKKTWFGIRILSKPFRFLWQLAGDMFVVLSLPYFKSEFVEPKRFTGVGIGRYLIGVVEFVD